MPRRDGTGPLGRGAMNGRGLGVCNGANSGGYGVGSGLGNRKDPGRISITDPTAEKTQKELLQEQKELLESKLDAISKQLENQ